MSSCDTEAGGIILLHRQGKVNKSRDVGLVEPDVLETGCSGLDASQHPPAGDQGNVPSCKSVIEPIATPSDIESALERYMEELNRKALKVSMVELLVTRELEALTWR